MLGFALVAALVLLRVSPLRTRVFDLATIVAGALLLNIGYLGRLSNFVITQALLASNPRTLAALFPESGTWLGWGRMFVDLPWPAVIVSAGVLLVWKGWWLARGRTVIGRAVPAVWSAASLGVGRDQLAAFDREGTLAPLLDAATATPPAGTLEAHGLIESQLTRRLRDALHRVLAQLQFGQVVLASVGSTAPFIGLFGTVWGIYHALTAIGMSGQASIDKVAGPVGEALIMTAIGLAVAVPAVLGYNWLMRRNKVAMEQVKHFSAELQMVLLSDPR